jgi:ABC-type transport system involved in cytochrome c biogenesis permease subunit
MATISSDFQSTNASPTSSDGVSAWTILQVLGSLKATVILFALSLVIVLVGTLAQDEMNMLDVKERYFLSWIAPLHIDDFFPQSFFPHSKPIGLVLPFPGGALIGVLLMINLVAAKTTRFKIHSSGTKLVTGLAFIAFGLLIAGVIVSWGNSTDGLQGEPGIGYSALWGLTLAGIAVMGAGLAYAGTRISQPALRRTTLIAAIGLVAFVVYALLSGFRIGDPGLRIVWQLAKGLGAGLVLMVGCMLVFDKQGGNVLLHIGVGLLMFGQFVFGDRQTEQRLSLIEGQSTNQLINISETELAFSQIENNQRRVIALPASRLAAANQDVSNEYPNRSKPSDDVITDPSLPVDIRVLDFFPNSALVDVTSENVADTGVGLQVMAIPKPKSGGADMGTDVASAYVEILDKETGDSLGKHLVSHWISEREVLSPDGKSKDVLDDVVVGEQTYEMGLRFHREVKPYWVQLQDVERVNYSGTETPRDYHSVIRIVNKEDGDDFKERVWMNNPLRYRGETFYQSNYTQLPTGKELTGIQVVRNSGWLIPYVACSITGLGMLVHFLGTLTRFVRRRERETRKQRSDLAEFGITPPRKWPVFASVAAFAVLASVMLVPWSAVQNSMQPDQRASKFDFYTAGKIPTQYGGRVMPLDAYARATVKAMSNKESIPLADAPLGMKSRSTSKKKLSAMQWLMEVATDQPELRSLPMFRIDAEEVRSELNLNRRESKLYTLTEIFDNISRLQVILKRAREKDAADLSFKEKKVVELNQRVQQFLMASDAFQLPVPSEITMEELQKFRPEATERDRQTIMIRELQRRMESVSSRDSPSIVAPTEKQADVSVGDPKWSAFAPAFFNFYSELVASPETSAAATSPTGVQSFSNMIKAYGDDKPAEFNEAVDEHLASLSDRKIAGYDPAIVGLERWMQSNWPTGVSMFLYLAALVLGLVYFFFELPRLRQVVWGTLALAIVIHTVAIICRITITGRAPVINLYSSAVFIGWAMVLGGLVVERIFKYGVGNVLSAATGVMSLLVAYGLNKGDTMPVLQAVLDTQFWLATHVISVTLGYVATLVAGSFGVGYLLASWIGKDDKFLRDIYRCCYGSACFGILFSFIGTVLGGLWADDSWGRFWGWDPKENGALLIVIWNALMLHARWDGMVKGRGFAMLAIGGNIVTAWSWFGTNALGIGLHSYGFTSGVMWWFAFFVMTQLAVVVTDAIIGMVRPRPQV